MVSETTTATAGLQERVKKRTVTSQVSLSHIFQLREGSVAAHRGKVRTPRNGPESYNLDTPQPTRANIPITSSAEGVSVARSESLNTCFQQMF